MVYLGANKFKNNTLSISYIFIYNKLQKQIYNIKLIMSLIFKNASKNDSTLIGWIYSHPNHIAIPLSTDAKAALLM